ncbi:unnamed protein product [Adineta steineri]|uniref:Snake toxin/toxin-like domain-containing protein n=1 Tax=Adineta steineri TaxID=433720 RepID=A0A820CI45_9BILA|nr:unnamed protein product [Adineta steineri]CAF4222316.1 unnamed protein product [Adineta steineri]
MQMKQAAISTFLLLVLLPMVASITCYSCSSGCNDPFSSSGIGSITCSGSCMKTGTLGSISRTCSAGCVASSSWISGTGISCCSDKDYCNGAWRSHDYSFALTGLIATLLIVLKIKCF